MCYILSVHIYICVIMLYDTQVLRFMMWCVCCVQVENPIGYNEYSEIKHDRLPLNSFNQVINV